MTITLTVQENDDLWNEAAQHTASQCVPDSGVAIFPMPKQLGTGHELAVELFPIPCLIIPEPVEMDESGLLP